MHYRKIFGKYIQAWPIYVLSITQRFFDPSENQLIDDQWRFLAEYVFNEGEINENDDIDEFWAKLLKYKNKIDIPIFNNLARFVLNILTLPLSNAACERIFSKVNGIKTKSRNKLITNTINCCLLSSQYVNNNGECVNFVPTEDMISNMTTQNLYTKIQTTLSSDNDSDEELFTINRLF